MHQTEGTVNVERQATLLPSNSHPHADDSPLWVLPAWPVWWSQISTDSRSSQRPHWSLSAKRPYTDVPPLEPNSSSNHSLSPSPILGSSLWVICVSSLNTEPNDQVLLLVPLMLFWGVCLTPSLSFVLSQLHLLTSPPAPVLVLPPSLLPITVTVAFLKCTSDQVCLPLKRLQRRRVFKDSTKFMHFKWGQGHPLLQVLELGPLTPINC